MDWRESYLLIGGSLLIYSPVAALFLRSRPEDIGLLPDGALPDATRKSAGSNGGSDGEANGHVVAADWTLREAMATSALWIIVSANALQWGIGAGCFFHLASIATEGELPIALLPACFYLPVRSAYLTCAWLADHPSCSLSPPSLPSPSCTI